MVTVFIMAAFSIKFISIKLQKLLTCINNNLTFLSGLYF